MKPVPTAEYPVRVRPMDQEVGGGSAALYDGAYLVTLNGVVTVAVVPETGLPVDQWDPDALPEDFDTITEPGVARLAAAVSERYVVTAGDDVGVRAFRTLADDPASRTGVALVVDAAEFARLSWDLGDLASFLGAVVPDTTVSALRGRPAIERIVELEESMAPEDARWLRGA